MALADDNISMSHVGILDNNDDHDILKEFLDQRVYDSQNANTPVGNVPNDFESDPLSSFHTDIYSKLSSTQGFTADELDHSLEHPDEQGSPNGSALPKSEHQGNDYLYLSPRTHASFSLNPSPSQSVTDSSLPYNSNTLDDHDLIRKEFSKVKFGNFYMNPCPPSINVTDPAALDFSQKAISQLPYQLEVMNLPSSSRVETQIKLRFHFSPAPKETFLHIPQDLISKSKFCLQDPVDSLPEVLKKNMLFTETYVLTSDLKKSCNICPRCIKREQKRASRSKSGAADSGHGDSPTSSISGSTRNNPNSWADEKMIKKAIFYNCKEIVSFPAPTGLVNDQSKSLDISARIICYCRHHKESDGFKLLFVVRDYENRIVAKHLSNPIMIMDRKKNATSALKENSIKMGSSSQLNRLTGTDELADLDKLHPLSPNSIDDSTSEALANTDTNNDTGIAPRGYKRKKLSFDDSYNSSTNPMFNGSGFSPLSNSDTNASIHNLGGKNGLSNPFGTYPSHGTSQSISLPRQKSSSQLHQSNPSEQQPAIQKIIPAQGPIRGGVEITILGFNFRPGLVVKFGTQNALATHCWSESTIVTYLPPAAHPGQVLVSFEDHDHIMIGSQQSIFTYTDDTDRQLIELALQIVGLKMNGKLEDARNIAKRIVGSDNTESSGGIIPSETTSPGMNQKSMEWYDNAHKAVEKLSRSDMSTEDILINFLSLVDLPNCPIIIPNWQLCNNQGQSLLHLATLKKYSKLIGFLITHGCKIDIKDNQGLTPLFFASMCGYRDLIKIFVECRSNWNLRLSNEMSLSDYCDLNVLDIFNNLKANNWSGNEEVSSSHGSSSDVGDEVINRTCSVDSLNSMYMMNYGRHVSRMVADSIRSDATPGKCYTNMPNENSSMNDRCQFSGSKNQDQYGNDSTDFADSELDSDDDFSDEGRIIAHRWQKDVDEDDYYDDESDAYDSSEDENNGTDRRTNEPIIKQGLWQKMKTAVFSNDSDGPLPSYDDLFPFGNGFMKPKTALEKELNNIGSSKELNEKSYEITGEPQHEDAGIASDSSEDMVMTYINHPRKTIKNDKMLLFFWLPVLVMIVGLFVYSWITGYNVEAIESIKEWVRQTVGSVIVGNDRLSRVFASKQVPKVLDTTT